MTQALAKTERKDVAGYTPEQQDIIRNHVAGPDFTFEELAYCLNVAKARGLDPLQKQVYFTKRKKKDQQGNYTASITVEPTIDGFRTMAERTEELDGYDGPYWCGEDGQWLDAWLSTKPPVAAKITVYRKGRSHGFTSVARYDAYVQTDFSKNPNHIWAKMHDNQLAKCAEALALRKAFPSALGQFYTREEMGQADNHADSFKVLNERQEQPRSTALLTTSAATTEPQGPPDVLIDVPAWFAVRFPQIKELASMKFDKMSLDDLELLRDTMADRKSKIKDGSTWKTWATALEMEATLRIKNTIDGEAAQ